MTTMTTAPRELNETLKHALRPGRIIPGTACARGSGPPSTGDLPDSDRLW